MSLHCHDIVTKPLLLQGELRSMLGHVEPNRFKAQACRGFSMVEVLAAVAIAVLLMALLVPAFSGLSKAGSRKSAVIKVLNFSEFARVSALSNSGSVYLGFANKDFPAPDTDEFAYKRMILFRDRSEQLDGPAGPNPASFVHLGKWEALPQGISVFYDSTTPSAVGVGGHEVTIGTKDKFPSMPAGGTLMAIRWNSTGMIEVPSDPRAMQLMLYEGFFFNNQPNFTRNNDVQSSSAGLFDQIRFSRFSGRAELVVTTRPLP